MTLFLSGIIGKELGQSIFYELRTGFRKRKLGSMATIGPGWVPMTSPHTPTTEYFATQVQSTGADPVQWVQFMMDFELKLEGPP